MSNEFEHSEVRAALERGVSGASEPDLVTGVWRSAGRRRRNRRLVAGSAVVAATAVAVVVSQWGGGAEDLGPADSAPPPLTTGEPTGGPATVQDQRAANLTFLEAVRRSGLAIDYEPLESPEWVLTHSERVLVGDVQAVRAEDDDFVLTIGVRQRIPDGPGPAHVDLRVVAGPGHSLPQTDLDAVGGPVVAMVSADSAGAPSDEALTPYPDGLWLDVPDGVGNPYLDWASMPPAWPQADSVADVAATLAAAQAALPEEEMAPEIECSASWQNPPPLNATGLSPAALDTANELVRLAATCDEDGLIAAAITNDTAVAVSDGDLEQQLATPDDNGAYVRLESTMGVPSAREGDLHLFVLEGWRVVIHDDGRWVEFSRG